MPYIQMFLFFLFPFLWLYFSLLHSQLLVLGSSSTNTRIPFSCAPKAVKTVALTTEPLSVTIIDVRPCKTKVTFPEVTSIRVYSPQPLKVYSRSSSVMMWGSPNSLARMTNRQRSCAGVIFSASLSLYDFAVFEMMCCLPTPTPSLSLSLSLSHL